MKQEVYNRWVADHRTMIEEIRLSAHALHASVNQTYDDDKPYGVHLDMVAQSVFDYGYEVCSTECDLLPLFFGAYYHDSIEDARLTYNDVVRQARLWMNEEQAVEQELQEKYEHMRQDYQQEQQQIVSIEEARRNKPNLF